MGSFAAITSRLSAQILSQLAALGASGKASGGPSTLVEGLMNMAPIALMFLVVYFLLLKPTQTQRRETQKMLAGIKKDDEIYTTGGLIGRIWALDDKTVTLDVADKTRIRVLRDRIAGLYPPPGGQSRAAGSR